MKEIKKVLIAMDYYKILKKVAEEGFTMAKVMNVKIILLHVIPKQMVYYSSYTYMRELWVNFIGNLEYSTQNFLDKTENILRTNQLESLKNRRC